MKYVVLKNFLEEDFCKNLIDNANKFIDFNKHLLIHGNRITISASNIEYNELCKNSEIWKSLEKKLNSYEFLEFCCKNVDLDIKKFCLRNFFKIKNPSKSEEIYKKISSSTNKLIPTHSLTKFLLFRVYREISRKIKFSRIFYPRKKPVELLYDYSKAGNGYSIEIHRDSDSRVVVFLLYLNSLSEDSVGGNLDLYKLIKEDKNLSRPDYNSCKKINSIKPEAGTLVIFLNENDSYHAVSQMKNHTDSRHFIYGGFTLLSQKNPYITNKSKADTAFQIYE